MHWTTNWLAAMAAMVLITGAGIVQADNPAPHQGTVTIHTQHGYAALVDKVLAATKANKMGVVARASATAGAKKIGVTIPGNQVIMVYHPKFAVRMLEAYVPAGIEAPIRYYITENADGTADLTYRTPTSVFAPYGNAKINAMAAELDVIFTKIAKDATE